MSDLSKGFSFKTTRILDRHGTLLYEINDLSGGMRIPVRIEDVSPYLIQATIATEDKSFYTNAGIDPRGIARALWRNVEEGQVVEGASTITQQLARNVLIEQERRTERSYIRKIQEAFLAFGISQQYSKDHILEMYLNRIYYGHLAHGIEAAAQTYFGKHARDLTLAEASLLAGLPQAPTAYDPLVNLERAKQRQSQVLGRMVDQGYISNDQAEQAWTERLNLRAKKRRPFEAPHFVMYVRQLLEQKYGTNVVHRLGLQVTTTLDLHLNLMAERSIQDRMERLREQDANNAALVAIDPRTGEILAMVGSRDYYDDSIDGQVNVAISPRQPGSTIKPIVYATAFSMGWGPGTIVLDEATAFPNTSPYLPPYRPHNFDHRFDGPMTVRHALATSKNVPAVKALMFAGIPSFLKVAADLGLPFENAEVFGLSLGLGAGSVRLLDMVGAYAALDNRGIHHPPVAILEVTDWQGNVLERHEPGVGRQVVSPTHAYMITSILADNRARTPLQGPNSPLKLSRPAAAKTGSTDSYRDAWLIGYTPELAAGVWVGNTDNSPMREVLGSMGAGRIWHQFMEDAHADLPASDFVPPDGIREYRLCVETGRPANADCTEVLTEVWPEAYTPERFAMIPGLPESSPSDFERLMAARARPLGQTVSPSGVPLQPIPSQPQRLLRNPAYTTSYQMAGDGSGAALQLTGVEVLELRRGEILD